MKQLLVRIFYAAAVIVSLMAGKICAASNPSQTNTTASASATWEVELPAVHEAFMKNDLRTLDKEHARGFGPLSGHPLEIYAQYWRLSVHLAADAAPDGAEIEHFLAQYQDTRLADQLRREWLKQLGKRGAWEVFSGQYAKFAGDDQGVTCYSWQERLEHQDREVLSEAKALWHSARSAPESCDPVFAALLAGKRLSADEIWARVRSLFESANVQEVKRIAAAMPEIVRLPERDLSAIGKDPGRYLVRQRLNPKSRASIELSLYAMLRLARQDAPEAADWLEKKARALGKGDQHFAWAQIGYQAAQQHEPRALEWYAGAGDYRLNESQMAWRVRAALRTQDWGAVQAGIEAMPSLLRREAAWRYWLGRAQKARGNQPQAVALFQGLSGEPHFYGLLAAEELGILKTPQWEGWRPQRADIDAVLAQPGVQRAFLLYKAGLPDDGLREWWWATRAMDDKQLLAVAEAANELGIPDRAMRAADRTLVLHDFSQRYPTPFREFLTSTAQQNQLDAAWVYGLIRQESAFVSAAKSHAGAIGLMQLMPNTAKWVAKRASLKNFKIGNLADIEINLSLGAQYLRHVLDDLGDPVLATAAYNAGPGRARRWSGETPLEGAIYAESIPFEETRDYVKRVMANAFYYASRLGAPRKSLKEMLGTVPGQYDRAPAKEVEVAARLMNVNLETVRK
jgi:soluble lytic murein transglycosylase